MTVVDSSVALEWFLEEPETGAAEALLANGDLATPDVILVEVANVLDKKVRAGQIELAHGQEGLRFIAANVRIEPSRTLVPRALELSVALAHPVYDCVFLACAEALGTSVVTRDRKFADRAAARGFGPQVWLLSADQS